MPENKKAQNVKALKASDTQKEDNHMKKRRMNLHLFEEGGENNNGQSAGNNNTGQRQNTGATFTYEQLNEIASSRAEHAEKAALKDYFQRNGLSEQEAAQALEKFKQDRERSKPNISALEQERDSWKGKYEQLEQNAYLKDKGVRAEDLDYVLFKVGQLTDEKTDFKKVADKFLKENPRFTGQTYRMSTSVGANTQGSTGSVHDSINDAIRRAAGR